MSYFACFKKISGHIFRFDTRIYIGSSYSIGERGECIGAIIGKNPGSALPTKYNQLCQISLNGDKMLPSVRNRFADSFRKAGVEPPRNAFVRVWNLFYLCNPKLSVAIKEFEDITVHEECWTEHQDAPPIV